MGNDYVHLIKELAAVENPVRVPEIVDWEIVETAMEVKFPQDFKGLVTELGDGAFGRGLTLRNPCSRSEYVSLTKETIIAHSNRMRGYEEEIGALYPSPAGMVQIGGIDRQEFYLRPIGNQNVIDQLLLVDFDFLKTREIGCSTSQLIFDLYSRNIEEEWARQIAEYIWPPGTPLFVPDAY